MEIKTPLSSQFVEEERNQEWTKEEDQTFEYALDIFDEDTPDRWENVAAVLPRKTVLDVIKRYKKLKEDMCEIEAGPVSHFLDSSFSPEMSVGDHSDGGRRKRCATGSSSENKRKKVVHWTEDEHTTLEVGPVPHILDSSFSPKMPVGDHSDGGRRKRSATDSSSENKRKKVVHWTEYEHTLFLLGLQKCGKGAWTNIARKFVVTKTPTQVASHAQKYYIRQKLSEGGKYDKNRRSSIHDITLLDENTTPIEHKSLPLIQESQILPSPPQREWIDFDRNDDLLMHGFQSKQRSSPVMPSPCNDIQNLQTEWMTNENNDDLQTLLDENTTPIGEKTLPLIQESQILPSPPQREWIDCDRNDDQLMHGFQSKQRSSQVMPSPSNSIQNLQTEWMTNDNNNDLLMVYNPNNDYEVGGAQQKKTSIQNVQQEWINCDQNNDQLMGFTPSNDIYFQFICAKRQSSGFKITSRL